jgi:hypothetical protein
MSRVRVLLAVAIVTVVSMPQSAEAGNWWEYIDKLSGPGPFHSLSKVSVPITPSITFGDPKIHVEEARRVRGLDGRSFHAVIEVANWDAQASAKFPDEINLWTISAIGYFSGEPYWKHLSGVDVGVGLGRFQFKGTGVSRNSEPGKIPTDPHSGSFSTVGVPIRLRLTPSEILRDAFHLSAKTRRILSAFQYEVGGVFLPRSFDNNDFKSAETFRTSDHLRPTNGVIVDLTPLIFKTP